MSLNLNTNNLISSIYTPSNISSNNTSKTNENSSNFSKTLEQNKAYDIQISKEALSLSNASNLAKDNFEKITKALENMTDYNTGEKVDFNALNKAQQKDLVEFLGEELNLHQRDINNENVDFSNVKIKREQGFVFASSDFIDDKGEKIVLGKDLLDLMKSKGVFEMQTIFGDKVNIDEITPTRYSYPLGESKIKEALNNLSYEDLAMDYLKGDKNGYFAYLKKNTTSEKAKAKLSFYENLAREHLKIEQEYGIDMSAKNLNVNLPDGRTIIRKQIEQAQLSAEFALYNKTLDNLFNKLFDDKNTSNSSPSYTQINEIKNSNVKQNEILKQALNLNKELDYKN